MGATAFVSMWVSNTATAAMMVPIALSVVDLSLLRRTGKTLSSTAAFRRTTSTSATSRCRCCSASPTRRRSAGSGRSSVRRPMASSSASSSRPTASRCRSRSGCWSACRRCCCFCRSPGCSTRGCCSRRGSARSRADGRGWPRESAKLGPLNRGERATMVVFGHAFFAGCSVRCCPTSIGQRRAVRAAHGPGIAVIAAIALFLIPVDRAKGLHVIDWAPRSSCHGAC